MQRLITTSEFYQTIDLIISPVILSDSHTVSQYVNKAFFSKIGYTCEQIPDQEAWFREAYPDTDYREEVKTTWAQLIEKAAENGDSHVHMIAKVRCANGSSKWFDVHENIFGDTKVVTFLDVDELQENNEELTDLLKQKDILLSIIAHDVRSPLGNIKQIVNDYKTLELSPEEIEEVFAGMGTQIDYIFNIINSLLVRTSSERGSFIEKRELIHVKSFFAKYNDYYRDRMEKHNIRFVFELSGNDTVNFDPFILDVISPCLMDNAIKYTPDNGLIYISFSETPSAAELTIRDTGAGMSEEQSERILNNKSSRRLKNQITDSFGLGLIMAKEMLERHRGQLAIESRLGQGTSFIIRLQKQ